MCAVYALRVPSESGAKVRKNRSRRGTKRRGRKSHARLREKRLALARVAPPAGYTSPSKIRVVGSERWAKHAARKIDFSRRLIERFASLSVKLVKVKESFRKASPFDTGRINVLTKRRADLCRLMKEARRSWIQLTMSSGDSKEFILLRFRMLVSEKNGFLDLERPWRVDPDWYGELTLEVSKDISKSDADKRPDDHLYECPKCMRTTNIQLCRLCGSRLTNANVPPKRYARPDERKRPRGAPSGLTRAKAKGSSVDRVQGQFEGTSPPPARSTRGKRVRP